MDNEQNCDICINVPSSQTYKWHLLVCSIEDEEFICNLGAAIFPMSRSVELDIRGIFSTSPDFYFFLLVI
jgi:hypothetical protein